MLHAVGEEDLHLAGIQLDWHGHADESLRALAALAQFVAEIEKVSQAVELGRDHAEDRVFQQILSHARL